MQPTENDSGKYWPWMILGFIFIGILLGFWTVQSAISMPVHESNEYQRKYQDADNNINKILLAKARFVKQYKLQAIGFVFSDFKPKVVSRRPKPFVALKHVSHFEYAIQDTNAHPVNEANLTLLITRPQTREDDQMIQYGRGVKGHYVSSKVTLKKPGRYILRLRAQIGDAVTFLEHEAYLDPHAQ